MDLNSRALEIAESPVILVELTISYMIEYKKMGWLKGLEPSTTGITIRGSTN
jgi:hypothetical protein